MERKDDGRKDHRGKKRTNLSFQETETEISSGVPLQEVCVLKRYLKQRKMCFLLIPLTFGTAQNRYYISIDLEIVNE